MTAKSNGESGSDGKHEQIEANLKRVYDETLNEPLPEKLVELLDQLKRKRSDEPR